MVGGALGRPPGGARRPRLLTDCVSCAPLPRATAALQEPCPARHTSSAVHRESRPSQGDDHETGSDPRPTEVVMRTLVHAYGNVPQGCDRNTAGQPAGSSPLCTAAVPQRQHPRGRCDTDEERELREVASRPRREQALTKLAAMQNQPRNDHGPHLVLTPSDRRHDQQPLVVCTGGWVAGAADGQRRGRTTCSLPRTAGMTSSPW